MSPVAFRVGTDLVEVSGIAESLERFGMRYLQRVYTGPEINYCLSRESEAARRLAARFAAKEAALKVLRPNARWVDWRSIEVLKMPGGWCELVLHGDAAALRDAGGLSEFSVSLSHENHYAMAVVGATVTAAAP